MSARKHEYAYDGIGNRRSSNTSGVAGLADAYAVNELNQYTGRENNTLAVGGTVADDANIKVVAGAGALVLAGRHGRHWGDNALLDNLAGPYLGSMKIFAAKVGGASGGGDLIKTDATRTAFLPPAWQTFSYDADGNLLSDEVWNYTWDAENRLVAMETKPEAIGFIPSADARRLEFKYDYLGRRIEKLVRAGWNGTNYSSTPTSQSRFVYDGWNLIAEYSVSGTTLTLARSYTWGLDIARSLTDAGGVGALLQIADHASGKTYLPAYDGNGNVVALLNGSTGAAAAVYEYSPFGEFLRADVNDAVVADQPFRFSTKYTDDETGLLYYGRRYYSPSQGRFLGRDPIDEKGGLHLYGFVGNNPTNRWDVLGNIPWYQTGSHIDNSGQMVVFVPDPDYQSPGNGDDDIPGTWEPEDPPTGDSGSTPAEPTEEQKKKTLCDGLKNQIGQANQIYVNNASKVMPGGIYAGGITLSDSDATTLAAGIEGALATGGVLYFSSQPVINGTYGLQLLTNGAGAAQSFRIAGYTAGGIAILTDANVILTSDNNTDKAFAGGNLATDISLLGADGVVAFVAGSAPGWLGPAGLAVANVQFGINMYVDYSIRKDASDVLNANAQQALDTAHQAKSKVDELQAQADAAGCSP